MLDQKEVLKLNRNREAIGVETPRKVFGDLSKYHTDRRGRFVYNSKNQLQRILKVINIEYEQLPNGSYNFDNVIEMRDVDWDEWVTLPVRSYDLFIRTQKRPIRVPRVVFSLGYEGMPKRRPAFNTDNVYEIYNGKCAYTNKKLARHEATKDHVIPRAKGGANDFSNVVLCDPTINAKKGDRYNHEVGLPDVKPKEPVSMRMSQLLRNHRNIPEWRLFLFNDNNSVYDYDLD